MNPYADPCELQSIGWPSLPKPRIRKRFGIWCCVTAIPFVFGHGYDPKDAYDEWVRVSAEQKSAHSPAS